MSIEAMTWVLRHSGAKLGSRLVLLALADYAHADGSEAYPSVDTLAQHTRLSRRAVQSALRSLEENGSIVRDGTGRNGTTSYRLLLGGAESAPAESAQGAESDEQGRSPRREGGEAASPNPSKGTVQDPSFSSAAADEAPRPDVVHLCHLLADLMLGNDPGAKVAPDGQRWTTACRLLIDSDGRTPALVEQVIRWSQTDAFWRANVLSMKTLREKFPQLLLQMGRSQPAAVPAEFSKYDRAGAAR